MRRFLIFCNVLLTIILGFVVVRTYEIKNTTRQARSEVRRLAEEQQRERATIQILQAEWSYLKGVDRLGRLLVERGADLGLVPLKGEQFIESNKLPRPASDSLSSNSSSAPGVPMQGQELSGQAMKMTPSSRER